MSPNWHTLDDIALAGKRVITRVDFNVPMQQKDVTDATRIVRTIPTIQHILKKGGIPILVSHLGRPESYEDQLYSLAPLVPLIERLCGNRVLFSSKIDGNHAMNIVNSAKSGEIVLLENIRFDPREKANDNSLASSLSIMGDVYCNDAFAVCHRSHASVVGLPKLLPACCGLLLQSELEVLTHILDNPERPLMAIVGGSKISTKIKLLSNLLYKSDILVVGGAMANTFLDAMSVPVGKSLVEKDMLETAREIIQQAKNSGCELFLPIDYKVAKNLSSGIESYEDLDCPQDMMILDIGSKTVAEIQKRILLCQSLVWNGPLGAFEFSPFEESTVKLANTVKDLTLQGELISLAGGGDTIAALNLANVLDSFTHVSTAGGAFLEWMQGNNLPGIEALGLS